MSHVTSSIEEKDSWLAQAGKESRAYLESEDVDGKRSSEDDLGQLIFWEGKEERGGGRPDEKTGNCSVEVVWVCKLFVTLEFEMLVTLAARTRILFSPIFGEF